MAKITRNSLIKHVCGNAEAVEAVEKYFPGFASNPQTQYMLEMPLKMAFWGLRGTRNEPGTVKKEYILACYEALEALGLEE